MDGQIFIFFSFALLGTTGCFLTNIRYTMDSYIKVSMYIVHWHWTLKPWERNDFVVCFPRDLNTCLFSLKGKISTHNTISLYCWLPGWLIPWLVSSTCSVHLLWSQVASSCGNFYTHFMWWVAERGDFILIWVVVHYLSLLFFCIICTYCG